MKLSARVKGFLWFLTVLTFLAALFTLTYFLTDWIYRITGLSFPVPVVQVLNSLGGLFIFGFLITTFSFVFRSKIREGEMQLYGPIIEALGKIAKGDFSVTVDNILDRHSRERSVVTNLVNSVNQMALDLNKMETMRQDFISNVSHEIQSPLTSIRGFAQALQKDTLEPETRHHYLTIIETESMRLSKLSDNLLKLSTLESEQLLRETKKYALDKQIRHLLLACEPQWLAKAIDLNVSLDEVCICADEELLSQVWLNLIHNSIKFTSHGGRVCVSLCRVQDKIEFKISDTGIGISEKDRMHIFERFYKADKSRTRSSEGNGLGLSIARKIVLLHNGTIEVESQLEAGTTFTVLLPAA